MKTLLLAAFGFLLAISQAEAQSRVVPMCGTTSTNPTAFAPCDTTYPLPVTGTFTGTVTANSAATAAAALPTLSAGSTVIYQSLGGAQYVQPVFSSTAGGGTQVDATHGLPVAVLAGAAVIGHVIVDAGTAAIGTITPQLASFTDKSGAMTTGGTHQTLAAINAARKRIVIVNPCTATSQNIGTAESLFINFTSAASPTAGGSIELAPCGSYDSGSGPVTTELIDVNAATTAHKFSAKEQ